MKLLRSGWPSFILIALIAISAFAATAIRKEQIESAWTGVVCETNAEETISKDWIFSENCTVTKDLYIDDISLLNAGVKSDINLSYNNSRSSIQINQVQPHGNMVTPGPLITINDDRDEASPTCDEASEATFHIDSLSAYAFYVEDGDIQFDTNLTVLSATTLGPSGEFTIDGTGNFGYTTASATDTVKFWGTNTTGTEDTPFMDIYDGRISAARDEASEAAIVLLAKAAYALYVEEGLVEFAEDIILDSSLIFEGATNDDYETTFTATDPTADRTITIPDSNQTIGTASAITDGLIVEADLDADETAADNDILTYDSTGSNFSWQEPSELITAGTNISWSGTTLNVDDAFLVNDADDQTSGNLIIDTNDAVAQLQLRDSGDDIITLTKSAGAGGYISCSGTIKMLPDSDVDDYIQFQTSSNIPELHAVGANMKITAEGGTVDFDDDNLKTTGNVTDGTNSLTVANAKNAYDLWVACGSDDSVEEADISDLGSYLENVVEDTSPQLGGDLDGQSYYVSTTGDLRCVSDSNKVEIGAQSGGDIQIYHDGSDSYIGNSTTGDLKVRNLVQDEDIIISWDDGGTTRNLTIDASANTWSFDSTTATTIIDVSDQMQFRCNQANETAPFNFAGVIQINTNTSTCEYLQSKPSYQLQSDISGDKTVQGLGCETTMSGGDYGYEHTTIGGLFEARIIQTGHTWTAGEDMLLIGGQFQTYTNQYGPPTQIAADVSYIGGYFTVSTADGVSGTQQFLGWYSDLDCLIESDNKLYLEGTLNGTDLTIGDTYLVYDSGNSTMDCFVDNTEVWNADSGSVQFETMANFNYSSGASTKSPETDAEDEWLEIEMEGTTYYIPLYAAS